MQPVLCFLIYSCTCFAADENVEDIRSSDSLQYDFDTIEVATKYFSPSNKLGQGGFGAVYKVKDRYVQVVHQSNHI